MPTKHAFISYVHEDEERADRLQDALEAAGIKVWRDKDDLPPGSDWATEIRKAITDGSLAFIACFSDASSRRDSSYQYEELTAAIDQFRKLPPNRQWLFPVRFDDVSMPDYSLGAGRTLDSIHRTDLFGARRDSNLVRLTAAVAQLVGGTLVPHAKTAPMADSAATAPGIEVKRMLREPSLEIELDDLVMGVAAKIRDGLSDEDRFSTSAHTVQSELQWIDFLVSRLQAYQDVLRPLAEILVVGGAWGEQKHGALWSRAVALVVNTRRESGNSRLIELQDFIPLYLTYVFATAATARENYYGLNEILATQCRRLLERQPLIERLHTGLPFASAEWVGTVVTLRAEGRTITSEELDGYMRGWGSKRYTPVSDYLFNVMKPLFTSLVPDERDFDEVFDQMEILLALKALTSKMDADAANRYAYGPWFGRYTWKSRNVANGPVGEVVQRYSEQGTEWKPFQQGLFWSERQLDEALPRLRDLAKDAARRR